MIRMNVCVSVAHSCLTLVTPWTPDQAPLSMGFSRQEYWSGLPCPPPGDPLNPGIKPRSPPLQADSLPSETPGKPKNTGKVSLSLLQGIFLMQESNWGLLHCRWILYRLRYQESTLRSCTHTNLVSNSILLKLCRRKNTRLLLP